MGHAMTEFDRYQAKWGSKKSKHPVTNPAHYTAGAVEAIDIIEQSVAHLSGGAAYCRGNALKYLIRAGRKRSRAEDLKKAAWYVAREISSCNTGTAPVPGP